MVVLLLLLLESPYSGQNNRNVDTCYATQTLRVRVRVRVQRRVKVVVLSLAVVSTAGVEGLCLWTSATRPRHLDYSTSPLSESLRTGAGLG